MKSCWRGWRRCRFSLRAPGLAAANLGDDAGITAAIVGQVAGVYYGAQGILQVWLNALWMLGQIHAIALALMQVTHQETSPF
ncbi:ADP-ribosyl-[dinitrogen reductase] hydrolase [Pseudomonas sp. 24 E 13]|jgi:ADP-ribosylglycohydrolase|nr:ADP-ribosyl-[dinitrogen reductase] hydrolase [Pseudomonas sp. 24 E 13]CRM54193.1 ADP-ribosyl-[dinitrogen reductase] hydrolase [Pseudomonas sp. 44 R 15]CRN00585.1 ADP-ribosyl-[dinitrogen reductase] hydrolase [Pseudomonas sp. 34 E 7]